MLTRVILGTVVVFLLMLVASANGIGWLKWLLALPVLIVSVLGGGMLILKQEHKRRRSWWMLASFAGLLLCTLVSLIARFPAPGI
jgi:cytochrome bd-type quinol oxidase subunit 2